MEALFKANFYPGPSRLYDEVAGFAADGFAKGLLSLNHRSSIFQELHRLTTEKLFSFLNVPEGYHLAFVSSATECWEIIAQSLIEKRSFHLYNGDFGQKWFQFSQNLKPEVEAYPFSVDTLLKPELLDIALDNEWICLTQNETSNGTQVHDEVLGAFRKAFIDQFIAIDATSSLGGIQLHIAHADLWFASVQKCFGLPSGLGLLIYSDAVIQKAEEIGENKHYNSFLRVHENAVHNQTHYTPNILDIYLLYRILEILPNVDELGQKNHTRAQHLYQYFQGYSEFQPITQNNYCYSDTVLAFTGEEFFIEELHQNAIKHGILLGKGYGNWKNNSFRIANFPAIPNTEIDELVNFFDKF